MSIKTRILGLLPNSDPVVPKVRLLLSIKYNVILLNLSESQWKILKLFTVACQNVSDTSPFSAKTPRHKEHLALSLENAHLSGEQMGSVVC